jgi:tryptophan-rich sensory protein
MGTMMNEWTWNRRSSKGLVLNLVFPVMLASLANGFIFMANPIEQTSLPTSHSSFPFPGWVIGVVWTLLFLGMGFARWLVLGHGDGKIRSSTWVFLLLLLCLAYPVYTLALRSLKLGLVGNLATIGAALWLARRIHRVSLVAASLVLAVATWVAFATVLILQQLAAS